MPSCLPPCARNLSSVAHSSDAGPLAEEAIAIAKATGDDAIIVRVLNHVSHPLQVPSLAGASTGLDG